MAVAVYAVDRLVSGWLPDGLVGRVLALGIPAAGGILAYFLLAILLGLPEVDMLRKRLKK